MSDTTQANPLFAPFQPEAQAPVPFTAAPDVPPAKRARKPRATVADAVSAGLRQSVRKAVGLPQKAKRKPRPPKQPTSPEQPRSVLDLQTILRGASGLKDEDFGAFDALLTMFDKMSKPQSGRILTALGKVFA